MTIWGNPVGPVNAANSANCPWQRHECRVRVMVMRPATKKGEGAGRIVKCG